MRPAGEGTTVEADVKGTASFFKEANFVISPRGRKIITHGTSIYGVISFFSIVPLFIVSESLLQKLNIVSLDVAKFDQVKQYVVSQLKISKLILLRYLKVPLLAEIQSQF
jgi:hypothetical protein